MQFKEETLKENYIYKGKVLSLKKDEVKLFNGDLAEREIVEHCGGSAVLCVKDDKIILVRQFRYAYKSELWELPAGKLNAGEDPKETAIRELEEECGLKAERAEKLLEVYPSPGYTSEIIRIFKVTEFKEGVRHLDPEEFLDSKWFTKQELRQMIKTGEIKDSKTLIALLLEL